MTTTKIRSPPGFPSSSLALSIPSIGRSGVKSSRPAATRRRQPCASFKRPAAGALTSCPKINRRRNPRQTHSEALAEWGHPGPITLRKVWRIASPLRARSEGATRFTAAWRDRAALRDRDDPSPPRHPPRIPHRTRTQNFPVAMAWRVTAAVRGCAAPDGPRKSQEPGWPSISDLPSQ
jgi:hypothetical protein